MKIRLWHWYRTRRREALAKAEEAEVVHARVLAQWPEVIGHAQWARDTRQRNHLTEMFFDKRGLRGGKP